MRRGIWGWAGFAGATGALGAALLLAVPAALGAEQISGPAPGWDRLWRTVATDIAVIGIVFAAITAGLLVRYRWVSPDQVGRGQRLTPAAAVGWVLVPAFVFLADDFYLAAKAWTLWNDYRQVPADRMEIRLESGMYSWDYTYPNGVRTQNELIVPAGKPVMLRMTSRDVIHSHYIPDFRVKEDSMPGRVTYLWFLPREAGREHVVTCAEYCGIMHSYMAGRVVVKTPAEFDAWLTLEAERQDVAGVRDSTEGGMEEVPAVAGTRP